MTRINAIRPIEAPRKFIAWGKTNIQTLTNNAGPLIFAAALVVCSLAVGCSSEKPQPVSSTQIPVTQSPIMPTPAPVMQAENKPAPKKVVRKKPATVNYTDKTYGVTFEYPRRYAIETGNAATELLAESPVPMNFVQPGGVALAAVELPETSFVNTDFSSAFFNVSVNKNVSADQCNQFAVPAPKEPASVATSTLMEAAKTEVANADGSKPEAGKNEIASAQPAASSDVKPSSDASTKPADATPATATNSNGISTANPSTDAQGSKLMLGDMELRATEAVTGEGTRQSDSKYFHVYQNGACYEFGLNVTTVASSDRLIKHVNRDQIFDRLEKILATVKINPVTPEATAETPAAPTPTAVATPAQ